MKQPQDWPGIAVVGAGAVGGYFGGRLAQAGAPVVLIGRKSFVQAVNDSGLVIQSNGSDKKIPVQASADMSAARDALLVLFCVKSVDTVSAARDLAPFLSAEATLICLQNGVDNAERIKSAINRDAVAAAVYVAASVPKPGHVKHLARGDLVIGPENDGTRNAAKIFERANIPCRISPNIQGELWTKLLCNCALNAISALGNARYGQIAADRDARTLMERVAEEVLSVARATNVVLQGVEDLLSAMKCVMGIATEMSETISSTAQDLKRGRLTEIDSLNGYVSRRGSELGISVPVNHALFTLVKLAERNIPEIS